MDEISLCLVLCKDKVIFPRLEIRFQSWKGSFWSSSTARLRMANRVWEKRVMSPSLKVLSFFFPSLSRSAVNGCFGQASWLQIVIRVWEGRRLLSHSYGGSQLANALLAFPYCAIVKSFIHSFIWCSLLEFSISPSPLALLWSWPWLFFFPLCFISFWITNTGYMTSQFSYIGKKN